MIKAIVFDLDDTLYPEIDYVKSGFKAIAKAWGDTSIYETLYSLFMKDPINVYQRAGFSEAECKRCIDIYRNHKPSITLDSMVVNTLKRLKEMQYQLGIITDGRPEGQKNKIKSLCLDIVMDCIIITDEIGGIEYRKPNPKSFEIMKKKLNVDYDEMMYVGDNPQKDFAIKLIYPISTVEIKNNGMYTKKDYLKGILPDYTINSIEEIFDII